MKEILIINGSGGVGKDTFVEILGRYVNVIHESIVNPVKKLANQVGWNGTKSEKDRKFLSDLKVTVDGYNDFNYRCMSDLMNQHKNGKLKDCNLLCIDMREKFQIEQAQKEYGAKTVLVRRESVEHITSNLADAGVFDMEYDFYIDNDGTLEDLEITAIKFLGKLIWDCQIDNIATASLSGDEKVQTLLDKARDEVLKAYNDLYQKLDENTKKYLRGSDASN